MIKITLIGGMPLEIQGGFVELLGSLFGPRRHIQFDFGSAHYLNDITTCFSEDKRDELAYWSMQNKRNMLSRAYNAFRGDYPPIEEVVKRILKEETSLDINRHALQTFQTLSTRAALEKIIQEQIPANKKIALPLPNWHFWSMEKNFAYFDGSNEDRLVTGFSRVAARGNIGALILVSPTNPLGYEISQNAARELDRVALKEGIQIIIDDVLRGTAPAKNRDSIGRWFSQPYIVEGFGKRFGDMPLGEVSYVLSPRDKKLSRGEETIGEDKILGQTLRLAYEYGTKETIEKMKERNSAFDRSMQQDCPELRISRATESSLISLVEMPTKKVSAERIGRDLYEKSGVIIGPITALNYPDNLKEMGRVHQDKFRITVGKLEPERIQEGCRVICETYKKLLGEKE